MYKTLPTTYYKYFFYNSDQWGHTQAQWAQLSIVHDRMNSMNTMIILLNERPCRVYTHNNYALSSMFTAKRL